MTSRQYGMLMKWQVDNVTCFMKWQVGKMAIWPNREQTKLQNGKKADC